MTLSFAEQCAQKLVDRLRPHVARIEIAGSIRRRREQVGDVDLVIVPNIELKKDMFGTVTGHTNTTRDLIRAWAAADKWRISKDGDDIMIVEHKGVQVDFYWAREESFGTYWMCRTGSREHNIWLAEIAKEAGGKWHPYVGLHLNHRVIAQTEAEIYGALDLPFLDPATDRDLPRLHRVRPGHPLPR